MKVIMAVLAILTALLLIPGTVNACLTTEQIFIIGKVAEQANVSVSDLAGIFYMICERSENATTNLTLLTSADVNATLQEELAAYKASIEDKLAIMDVVLNNTLAIRAMTRVMNTSRTLEAIDDKIEDIKGEFDDRITTFEAKTKENVQDIRASAVNKGDLESVNNNLTNIHMRLNNLETEDAQNQPLGTEVYAAGGIVIAVLGYIAYTKKLKAKKREDAINTASRSDSKPIVSHASHIDHDRELEMLRKLPEVIKKVENKEEEERKELAEKATKQIEEEKKQKQKRKAERTRTEEDPFN
jgi:hypothetical protein